METVLENVLSIGGSFGKGELVLNIDFNVTDILPDRWWDLTQNVFGNKTFDKREFISLFNETFEVLRYCACEDAVHKELIELVKNVSGFLATRFSKVGYDHLAACELTDAMLENCLQSETRNWPITKGKWFYVYEVELDFTKADEALFIVTQDIETWDSIPTEDLQTIAEEKG